METPGKFAIGADLFAYAHSMLWYVHIKAHDYHMNWTTEEEKGQAIKFLLAEISPSPPLSNHQWEHLTVEALYNHHRDQDYGDEPYPPPNVQGNKPSVAGQGLLNFIAPVPSQASATLSTQEESPEVG